MNKPIYSKHSILHVIETLERGGAESRLLEDVRNLVEFNHEVCYLFKDKDSLEDEFRKVGAKVYCLAMRNNIDFFNGFIRFFLLIKKCKPDIIHTHLFFSNIISRLACIFYPKIAYVQTIHAPDYKKNGSYIYSHYRYILELVTLMFKTPRFIAVSEYVKKQSLKSLRIKEGDVEVIYNYLNDNWLSDFEPEKRENNPRKMISVTHLHKQKGVEYLIRAMKIVLDSGKVGLLYIVGDGQEKQSLSILIQNLNLDKNVFLLGKRNDVRKLISENDIFIFPSVNEGLGIALIEAMSQEKICIAFSVGPIPEIIDDGFNGFLVQSRDIEALAKKIIYVIDNYPQCKEISERARLKVKAKFSKENSVRLLAKCYHKILNPY